MSTQLALICADCLCGCGALVAVLVVERGEIYGWDSTWRDVSSFQVLHPLLPSPPPTSLLCESTWLPIRKAVLAQDHEERTVGQPADTSALPTSDSYTSQPERTLQPGNPSLVGAAPPDAKQGMAEKVKGMFKKGHHEEGHADAAAGAGDGADRPLEGVTNEQGGAALTDEQGNLKPGPHQDAVKRDGVISKIKDKLHGGK